MEQYIFFATDQTETFYIRYLMNSENIKKWSFKQFGYIGNIALIRKNKIDQRIEIISNSCKINKNNLNYRSM